MNNIARVRRGGYGEKFFACPKEDGRYLKIISADIGDALAISADGNEFSLNGGEVAVIPSLVPHSVRGGGEGTLTLYLEQPMLPLREIRVFADVAGGGVRKAAEQAAIFCGSEGGAQIMNALGALLVGYICMLGNAGAHSPVVAMLKEDIERSAGDCGYSVEAAMRKLPLNYDYVRKLFKKETGLTPHEYLTSVRMERAGKIILSGVSNRYSSYTVGQIAEACGYAEPLYFSRVFKKYFGVSPTGYSKNKQIKR